MNQRREGMVEKGYEKQHLKTLVSFTYITLASLFSFLFLLISIYIISFSMTGILDFPYLPSKVVMAAFILSILFSVLALRTIIGKILIVTNTSLLIFMVLFGI
jgi:hypothetical protein